MLRDTNYLLRCFSIIILLTCMGCSKPPTGTEVSELIVQYYESRGYRVTELKIREIQPIPLGKREYMSTKGHLVHIRSITLRLDESDGEKEAAFPDALIEIHRSRGDDPAWAITDIQGIPVL